jgi:serine protease
LHEFPDEVIENRPLDVRESPQGFTRVALSDGLEGEMKNRYGWLVGLIALSMTTAMSLALSGGAAQAAASGSGGSASASPSYRHGEVATKGSTATGSTSTGSTSTGSPTASALKLASTANDLTYGGGIAGVGVTTGKPRVYLVFWGSQWGTRGTKVVGGNTYDTYSGDAKGMAPDLEAFFTGLGSNGETWSGVATEYCQGVAVGTVSCPNNVPHVGYPTGGAFAGAWEDTSTTAPHAATAAQLATEAENAASHFGNTTQASNANVQYFIVSPTGTQPDGFNTPSGNFCAWHDYTGDTSLGSVSQPNGMIAFTNMPYVTDLGASCGQNFVNAGAAGTLDGVTIVGGHEYTETITDQFPAGGWTDSRGYEIGDKCAWISSGQGAAQNITLASGTFAIQSMWANDFNGGSGGCEVSHPIFSSNTVTVTSPGNQTSTDGTAITPLQVGATDSAAGQTLSFSATGLPAGLSISPAGVISGTPTATVLNGSVTVTATDTTGASGNATFTWTVNAPGGNTVSVTNPGTQTSSTGSAVSLQIHASDSQSGQTLTYGATGLPAGLSINASTGVVSGTPTSGGSNSVTVTARDTTGASGSATFGWTINVASNKVTVTNPGNQSSRMNRSLTLQINATDSANGQTLTYSATGLPTGLKISATSGAISGTPTAVGTFSTKVTATDTTGASGSAAFTWTVRNRFGSTTKGTAKH